MIDAVYAKQDSLGLKSWGSYARDIGLLDTAGFARCVAETAPVRRIEEGKALGTKFGVQATPTVFVNGWRYSIPPDQEELSRVIKLLLAGQQPFTSTR